MDLVAHCGWSGAGPFSYTLSMADVATGWIDGLFSDTVDWQLIQDHWPDLMQVALSIKLAQLSLYQTRTPKRFGDYTLSLGTPDPFETDLVVSFPVEETAQPAATA